MDKTRLDKIAAVTKRLKDLSKMKNLSDKEKSYIHSKIKELAVKEFQKRDKARYGR